MNNRSNAKQRAVMYLRVASAHEVDASAVTRQREACLRIAARHGLTVIREYADVGRPAQLDQQLQLRRLLDDLFERQDAAFVVVYDYPRLGRSLADLNEVEARIRGCGAEVVTITGVEAGERFVREWEDKQPARGEED